MRVKTVVMDSATFERTLIRIAHEIIEKNNCLDGVVLLGVYTRGVYIARRLSEMMAIIDGKPAEVYTINPKTGEFLNSSNAPISREDLSNKTVVIVDDVLHTCRTVNYVITEIDKLSELDVTIQLVAMIDRGHKKYPICADYLGREVPTSSSEIVSVNIKNYDKTSGVLIYELKD